LFCILSAFNFFGTTLFKPKVQNAHLLIIIPIYSRKVNSFEKMAGIKQEKDTDLGVFFSLI